MGAVTILVILEPKGEKNCQCFPSICHGVMGHDARMFVFGMLSFK